MKNNYILILVLLSTLFTSCLIKQKENFFVLHGVLNESNTKQVILYYRDNFNKSIRDTIKVKDNRFFTKGFINGATRACIEVNKKNNIVEDSNLTYFFLEPKRIDISQIENKFKKVIISGSNTQTEYVNIVNLVEPISSEIRELMLLRSELEEKKKYVADSTAINNSIDVIDAEWIKKLDEILKVKLKYAWNNPNSYLSAYFIDQFFTKIPSDSTLIYYKNLNSKVKTGLYGMKIKEKVQKRAVSKVGALAPKFETKDMLGNTINLNMFKGKYVLLDFWASWCKSCRENNPNLRRLYKKYNYKGFEIISLSLDDDEIKWKNAIVKDSLSDWHHIYIGRRGTIGMQYNTSLIPDYVLIDKSGYIIGRNQPEEKFNLFELEKKLKEIFN